MRAELLLIAVYLMKEENFFNYIGYILMGNDVIMRQFVGPFVFSSVE